ncbi:hypothetical protein NOR51B_1391 [Luminiphilus syltensis NOR5-1B]|uniref:EthD domain-containing protein n=1 Tax=Luminiphilus syltensis NOR5-1B TaxID=565045 RepID=B8KS32_9GAMM|nr:hypothetical protein [Luminiphilus syltensis]EED35446.1 hypothetical protein NOR51B_1391 [Luminiphilus syltensis NOR5-1B]
MGVDHSFCQFKVWAFLKRNVALLSHDEYRAGHVGFHCSNTRRLNAIRGYSVNIHDEDSTLSARLALEAGAQVRNEPRHFLSLWDGFPAVYFDSWQSWTQAGVQEPTRATKDGVVIDVDWTLADGPYLFDRVSDDSPQFRSYHIRMEEMLAKPVLREERRPVKLVQFFRAKPSLSAAEFKERLRCEYLVLLAELDALNGLIGNLRYRDIDAAVRGYYPEDHWCFTEQGRTEREAFFDLWDGANELYFSSLEAFIEARRQFRDHDRLNALEDELFEANWYVAVDENVIVMPNRSRPPEYYFR